MKVKTDKATGYDNIPPRAIKKSAEIICYPFSVLFNHILENSRIPQQWKLGLVSPVLKKDCCLTKLNYRPITILHYQRMLTTQIFFADSTAEKVEEVINADLANVDKWYEENGMKRNSSKYQAIVMEKSQVKPQFYCETTGIPITGELEMLGLAVDDKMKFEST